MHCVPKPTTISGSVCAASVIDSNAASAIASMRSRCVVSHAGRFGRGDQQGGREAREQAGSEHDTAALLSAAQEVLSDYGFEPCTEADGRIRLRNCPFHALAERHRELVCGMNVELMRGLVDGLPVGGIEAVLDPQPGMCCVSFGPITLPS